VREGEGFLIYKCRYGLTEVICPLHTLGSPSGYLMMGQVIDENTDTDNLKRLISLIGAKNDELTLVDSIHKVSTEKTVSFAKIMTICAEYMTLINALPGNKLSTAELARLYVYENFRKKITIQDICQALSRTKSAICPAFKNRYGKTVIDYMTELRIDEAKKMLSETDMPVGEISDELGFTDTSYFSKVFLKIEGKTPSKYRRDNSI
jgi:YesN/AraC family two-component response regulator